VVAGFVVRRKSSLVIHALPEVLKAGGDLVGELLWWDSGGRCGALHLLAVLVVPVRKKVSSPSRR